MGRQRQGMDKPGVWQVPEGSGEQGKMEKTGRKIICGAPTTLAVKGLMMLMMMCRSSGDHRGVCVFSVVLYRVWSVIKPMSSWAVQSLYVL